ncbi:molybdate ABC transporter substrate-binding protein [Pseudalkalibacillus salsuginis]|uniref:molybdate ABC transporter substrate-binding protein n=1 Tax=Pseudalkalibacillus salsuginis TaxID=2910972 RepID=UPI001F1B841E|nr:molybdate ABC transporter substrate-binding protein [Pseudalkalibacillus salsuginis]MCF6411229.1 molybdate ABC transporter substrate-binding protein [Pseudalkalibacillus salsuginis]
MRYYKLVLMVLLLVLTSCQGGLNQGNEKVELHVHAAASLSDALQQIKEDFEDAYPEMEVILNFASSGTLQRQIEQGAPADLFISASEKEFNQLDQKNQFHPEFTKNILSNQLVFVTNKSNKSNIQIPNDLKKDQVERISIGAPESVPAGKYAKETLENMELWKQVKDKIIYGKDVLQVLSYIETGNVDVGFVYASDAKSSSKVKVQTLIDSDLHSPIIYPAGVLKNTQNLDGAKQFYDYLQNQQAKDTFKKFGFKPID